MAQIRAIEEYKVGEKSLQTSSMFLNYPRHYMFLWYNSVIFLVVFFFEFPYIGPTLW